MWAHFWVAPLLALSWILAPTASIDNATSQEVADASTSFSLELLQTVLRERMGNVLTSPVSVSTLLAMLQQGALGRTREQLSFVLHMSADRAREGYGHIVRSLKKRKTNSLVLEFGNKVYAKSDFEVAPEYKQILIRDFLSDVETADFLHPVQSASQINSWVANITHNRIPTILKPSDISERTQMVLVNGIFLKGVWLTPFREENTSEKTFSPNPGVEIKVPMMHQTGKFRAGDDPNLGAKWVELPFDGEEFSMVLVLPNEKHGLDKLVSQMKPQHLANMLGTRGTKQVYLTLPRFKISTQISLVPILKKLGLEDIFNANSNLGGITTKGGTLTVSNIIQKAEIEINEKGGTASAATAVLVATLSLVVDPDELVFNANQPFLAIIVHRVNSVPLFAGRVSDPSVS
ncbi:serpin B4-like [Periplaneta americana]|uniref:serpin B4-like n=1 Tax=Periplaneta americana TaxID=6978 RepID=UPI0037E8620F